MCEICRSYPCDYRCPNYEPKTTDIKCEFCGEYICIGEQYLENDNGEYAHIDCVDYTKDLLDFLGYEIKEMSEE